MSDQQPDAKVIDLRRRAGFRPDIEALARGEVANARRRLGLTIEEFAEVLQPILGWAPNADIIECWETSVVPPGDVLIAASIISQASTARLDNIGVGSDLVSQLVGKQYADVDAIFPTRSEFTSRMSPSTLFGEAKHIDAAGLSLNMLCQQYPDDQLRRLIETGTTLRCLFLAPYGEAIKAREQEEGYPAGHLSALTDLNIQILAQRVRQRLPADARPRLTIATYDETVRFNLLEIDRRTLVVQPYLHAARGVESPTFVVHKHSGMTGMFGTFEQTFAWLWERRTEL
jgi:hypothetical protein